MQLGIFTFADIGSNPVSGEKISAQTRLNHVLEEAVLADQLGLDVFAVGEHHRPDFAISAPAVVLAAIAVKTKNIKLSSAVSVISSDDPVRVFQEFATVDNLSNGRVEIMAGRGSFIESFPLFGYNLDDYDALFEEKLELLLQLNRNEVLEWQGKFRPSINKLGVYPRPVREMPVWVAVGGTPASVIRAAKLNIPLALAIIGGFPQQFTQLIKLYKDTYKEAGHDEQMIQLSINSQLFVAEHSASAAETFWPGYAQTMNRIGKERGWSPITKSQFDSMRSPKGYLLVGDVQEVTEKILYEYELFGNTRFLAQMAVGYMPHEKMMKSIELFGDKVAPAIRKYTKQ
jgi:probable LLM family oxidoreductase